MSDAAKRVTNFLDDWIEGSHNGEVIYSVMRRGVESNLTVTDLRTLVRQARMNAHPEEE